jgi:putative phosphoribosyl transferase
MEPLLPRPYLPHLEGGPAHLPIDAGCARAPERRGFRDRREAGRHLARALAEYAVRSDVMVLALPCGGVPVAYEVARALGAPLDVFPEHEPCELPPEVRGRTVILVDDGSATPAHLRAAAASLRQAHPGRIVVAIPAAAPDTLAEFSGEVDEIVCARTPEPFYAAGMCYLWYQHSAPAGDEEIRDLLADFAPRAPATPRVR